MADDSHPELVTPDHNIAQQSKIDILSRRLGEIGRQIMFLASLVFLWLASNMMIKGGTIGAIGYFLTVVCILAVGLSTTMLIRKAKDRAKQIRQLSQVEITLESGTSEEWMAVVLNKFITNSGLYEALQRTLPIGKHDKEYGFDHVPFLLDSLKQRRARFQKSSNFFFLATVLTGGIFTSTILYLGYIVVDESAISDGARLSILTENTSKIKDILSLPPQQTPMFSSCNKRLGEIFDSYGFMELLGDSPLNRWGQSGLHSEYSDIKSFYPPTNLDRVRKIADILKKSADKLEKEQPSKIDLRLLSDIKAAAKCTQDFLELSEIQVKTATEMLQALGQYTKETQKQQHESAKYIGEILKRLFLGLVVVSFLLAILRYVAGLYREHYRQILIAEQQDLSIRRFYVGFMCTKDNPDQRKMIIEKLLSETDPSMIFSVTNSKESEQINTVDSLITGTFEVFKKSLDILEKKIEKK